MKRFRVILDTNVVLAAMRSQTGASHRLLATIGHPRWQSVVVSFNERHLRVIREFGIEVLKPVDLLKLICEIK